MKVNENNIAFGCFLLFFGIETFQWVTEDSNKKSPLFGVALAVMAGLVPAIHTAPPARSFFACAPLSTAKLAERSFQAPCRFDP
jgi:hypothetical protein